MRSIGYKFNSLLLTLAVLFSSLPARGAFVVGKDLTPDESFELAQEMHYNLFDSKTVQYYIWQGLTHIIPQMNSDQKNALNHFLNDRETQKYFPHLFIDDQQRIILISPFKIFAESELPPYIILESINLDRQTVKITTNLFPSNQKKENNVITSLISILMPSAIAGKEGEEKAEKSNEVATINHLTQLVEQQTKNVSNLSEEVKRQQALVTSLTPHTSEDGTIVRTGKWLGERSAWAILSKTWGYAITGLFTYGSYLLLPILLASPLFTLTYGSIAAATVGLGIAALVGGKLLINKNNRLDDQIINMKYFKDECQRELAYFTDSYPLCQIGNEEKCQSPEKTIKNITDLDLLARIKNGLVGSGFAPGINIMEILAEKNQEVKMDALIAAHTANKQVVKPYKLYQNQAQIFTPHIQYNKSLQKDSFSFGFLDALKDHFNIVRHDLVGGHTFEEYKAMHERLKVVHRYEERLVTQLHNIYQLSDRECREKSRNRHNGWFNSLKNRLNSLFSKDGYEKIINEKVEANCKALDELKVCRSQIKNILDRAERSCKISYDAHFKTRSSLNPRPWERSLSQKN